MRRPLPQVIVVALALVPAALIIADVMGDRLGANPIEEITHRTGDWTIRLLLGALAVTPLRRLSGWNGLIRFRRTVGLLAFTYACLQFLTWAVLDQGLFLQGDALGYVLADVPKRHAWRRLAALVLGAVDEADHAFDDAGVEAEGGDLLRRAQPLDVGGEDGVQDGVGRQRVPSR